MSERKDFTVLSHVLPQVVGTRVRRERVSEKQNLIHNLSSQKTHCKLPLSLRSRPKQLKFSIKDRQNS